MNADGSSRYYEVKQVQEPFPSTALLFDGKHELLISGNQQGRITSYVMDDRRTSIYTRYAAHTPARGPHSPPRAYATLLQKSVVYSLLEQEHGIFSLSTHSVHFSNRQGLCRWHTVHDDPAIEWSSMAPGLGSTEVVLSSKKTPRLSSLATDAGRITREMGTEESVLVLKRSSYLCCGNMSGTVALKDPRSLRTEHTLIAHTAMLMDMDVNGHVLATCGFSQRGKQLVMDPQVKLFDLRNMKSLVPISVPSEPFRIRLHPKTASSLFVMTRDGYLQMCDISDQAGTAQFYQALPPGTECASIAISSTGDCLSFSDSMGVLHHWVGHTHSRVNVMSKPLDIASPYLPPSTSISLEEEHIPLNSVGMPSYDEPLLSALWPAKKTFVVGLAPPSVPVDILERMKIIDNIGYASIQLQGKVKRNQSHKVDAGKRGRTTSGPGPKFKSEREREMIQRRMAGGILSQELSPIDAEESGVSGGFPSYYRRVEIRYSRFGVEDFDFNYYNRTEFAGLETHMTNSYCNSFLQVLFYSETIRRLVVGHMCFGCEQDPCLACELAFLFRMLDTAKGGNCQATNFLRALDRFPEVRALGLIEPDRPMLETPYAMLIQNFSRFLMDKLHLEMESLKNDLFKTLCSIDMQIVRKCTQCECESKRKTSLFSIELQYPSKISSPSKTINNPSFTSIFASIFSRDQAPTKAWCEYCQKYSNVTQYRVLEKLPTVLTIQCGMIHENEANIWKAAPSASGAGSSFLCQSFSVKIHPNGSLDCDQGGDLYKLSAVICQIQNGVDPTNLVAFVRHPQRKDVWLLFNDFLVREVSFEEVSRFSSRWKIPAVLQFTRTSINEDLNETLSRLPAKLDRSWLRILTDPDIAHGTVEPLSPHEIPTDRGFLIVLDAEFVALSKEEMEFRSDGTKSLLRPIRMHLARVSILRAEGKQETVPFVDDYVASEQPVVDYLTEYSGIMPDDLEPNNRRHPVLSLKLTYRRIRLLVDLGCIFIGHGLTKDFRTINIVIPPSQVIDTLDIYRIEGQRKLSLRFLAWFVLKLDIQTHTHDSIEDARIVRFDIQPHELKKDNSFKSYLEHLYDEGRKLNWRAPHWVDKNVQIFNSSPLNNPRHMYPLGMGSPMSHVRTSAPGSPRSAHSASPSVSKATKSDARRTNNGPPKK